MLVEKTIIQPNTLIIRTDFSNYGTSELDSLIRNVGTIDKQTVLLLKEPTLWTDEHEQRLLTVEEWNKATKLWNELNQVSFIEQLNNVDMVWNSKNAEYFVDKIFHHAMFELMNQDSDDGYIDFYFRNNDNVEICCSILETFENDCRRIKLSPYVNIAVNGLNLDYEYESYNMIQKRFLIIFE